MMVKRKRLDFGQQFSTLAENLPKQVVNPSPELVADWATTWAEGLGGWTKVRAHPNVADNIQSTHSAKSFLSRAWRYSEALGRQSYLQVSPNLFAIGLFSALAFVAYYFIWAFLYPQQYENLTLRLIGTVLCLVLAFRDRWPAWAKPYERSYFLVATLYCGPFFFTFMALQNHVSFVWVMSMAAVLFFLALLLDWLHLLVLFTVGTIAAWLVYAWSNEGALGTHLYFEYLPTLAFMVLGGMVYNYKTAMIRQERMQAITSAASALSDELRPPLQLIRTGAASLSNYLPSLIKSHLVAQQQGLPVSPIEPMHLEALEEVPSRVETEVEHVLAIINMLLMNSSQNPLATAQLSQCRMSECVENALALYPYKSERERDKVVWRRDQDFDFHGSKKLMIHVLLNLLKASLREIAVRGTGKVYISAETSPGQNHLLVRDTGTWASAKTLSRIFEENQGSVPLERESDSGLLFCRAVIEGFGGGIEVASEVGGFTEFQISLPALQLESDPIMPSEMEPSNKLSATG